MSHHSHPAATSMPDQQKRNPQARKDNSFLGHATTGCPCRRCCWAGKLFLSQSAGTCDEAVPLLPQIRRRPCKVKPCLALSRQQQASSVQLSELVER